MASDRVHALIDELCGQPDAAAVRAVDVLHAWSAALAWVRQATGSYPTPPEIAIRLHEAAAKLRDPQDTRDPDLVLVQVAATALAAHRSRAA